MVSEGYCPKCGYHYIGWSLHDPKLQTCPACGAKLKTSNPNHRVIKRKLLSKVKEHIMDLLNTPIPPYL